MRCRASAQLGKARRIDDAAGRYIEFCKSTFPNRLDLRGLKIVVDCANGAAYHIGPHVFHELGADVVAIGVNPDGFNINDLFGATSPQSLQLAVKEHKADLGIALDGDGDRLVMVDERGHTYDGDQLLYVIARMRAGQGAVPGVVGTLMSNLALERALEQRRHRVRPRQGGRSLCAGVAAGERLAAGRREFRPHHLPGQAHHRRCPGVGAAGADGHARERCDPGRIMPRADAVSAEAGERRGRQGLPTGRRTRRWARPRKRPSTNWARPGGSCCGPRAPSRCCGSWSRARMAPRWRPWRQCWPKACALRPRPRS